MVFVRTKLPQYLYRTVVSLERLTDYSRVLVAEAIQGLRRLWRKEGWQSQGRRHAAWSHLNVWRTPRYTTQWGELIKVRV